MSPGPPQSLHTRAPAGLAAGTPRAASAAAAAGPPAISPRLRPPPPARADLHRSPGRPRRGRSEEHTSELQSHHDLVCRLLLEKKKNNCNIIAKCTTESYNKTHYL